MGDYSNYENSEIDYNFIKTEDDGQLRDNLEYNYESFNHSGDNDGNIEGIHRSNEGNDEFNAFKYGNNIDNNLINEMDKQDKDYHPDITFNIPGAFDNGKSEEKMDIDDSPPFTIESDLYFDSQSQQNVDNDLDYDRKEMFQSHFNRQQFLNVRGSNSLILGMGMMNGAAPGNSGVGNINGNISTPTPSSALQFDTPKSTQFTFDNHHDNNSIYSSFLNDNEVGSFNEHIRTQSIDGSSFNPTSLTVNPNNPNSLNIGIYQNYELSPLTTTTSLTPSVNSLHSNQPSFFSAQQYLSRHSVDNSRNSFDQNSLSNSINNSINSGNQKRNVSGRYLNFNSISNYIPFMNDKRNNGQTSPNGPPSPLTHTTSLFNTSSTPRQQSKHLIRSIFKSNPSEGQSQEIPETEGLNINYNNNLGPDMEEDFQSSDFLMMSPQETDDNLDPLPTKKAKKTKRGLFNRFKGPKQDETFEIEQIDNSSKNSGNNSFHEDENDHIFHGNMSRTPSSANTVRTNNNVNVSNGNVSNGNTSNGNISLDNITTNSQDKGPDYAALFENVGKRKPKKVSKPSNSLSFKKKIKTEDDYNDIHSNNLYGSESLSVSTSNTSHSYNIKKEEDDEEDYDDDESLTSAKRILGSKLMKRKGVKKEADIKNIKTKISSDKGVEVEVDLKTLDLPESTQIYPANIVNSKSRIRGRKENKEADLTDSSKIYLCNYCSRRFKRQEHLKRHFRSLHTFEKPYDCDICHKKFSRSDNLNQHLKIHKQEEEMMNS